MATKSDEVLQIFCTGFADACTSTRSWFTQKEDGASLVTTAVRANPVRTEVSMTTLRSLSSANNCETALRDIELDELLRRVADEDGDTRPAPAPVDYARNLERQRSRAIDAFKRAIRILSAALAEMEGQS